MGLGFNYDWAAGAAVAQPRISLRQGSLRPVYANAPAPPGETNTIQAGGTFTLYNGAGEQVAGFAAVALSGYDATTIQIPKAWYVLNTAALPPGLYAGVFKFDALGSDTITRGYDIDLQIDILPPVEVEATFDETLLASSALFQTRLHASDQDLAHAIFSDLELLQFLAEYGQVPELAAAAALDVLALDEAKLSNAVTIGGYGNGKVETYKAIVERAAHLRAIAPFAPVVTPTHDVFTMGNRHGSAEGGYAGPPSPLGSHSFGSMDDW